ncbi:MAG TPA: hypothetical protein VF797_19595 [Noviherbaspirillum sp.]|jgi:hypothetical protein
MSNTSENHARQVATQLISALNDDALDAITGGYDPVTARATAELMFNSGQVKADGVPEEVAIDRLAHALEGLTFIASPPPAA